jgi:hypothetical protein
MTSTEAVSDALLRVRDVSLEFDGLRVLQSVNVLVEAGSLAAAVIRKYHVIPVFRFHLDERDENILGSHAWVRGKARHNALIERFLLRQQEIASVTVADFHHESAPDAAIRADGFDGGFHALNCKTPSRRCSASRKGHAGCNGTEKRPKERGVYAASP